MRGSLAGAGGAALLPFATFPGWHDQVGIAQLTQKLADRILQDPVGSVAKLDRLQLAIVDPTVDRLGWTLAHHCRTEFSEGIQPFLKPNSPGMVFTLILQPCIGIFELWAGRLGSLPKVLSPIRATYGPGGNWLVPLTVASTMKGMP